MPELRILWTALPREADDEHLVIDVFVSHRLGVDAPPTAAFTLADFTELVSWPSQVSDHLSFEVEFAPGGPQVPADRVPLDPAVSPVDLDAMTWARLFPSNTRVEPWRRRDPGSRPLYSFPIGMVADYIRDRYRQAGQTHALDPTPDDELGAIVDDLGGLLDTRPDAERPEPTSETKGGETTGGGPAPGPQGCVQGCLTAPFAWLVWLIRRLWELLAGGPSPGPPPATQGAPPPPVSVTPKVVTYAFPPPGPAAVPPAIAAIEQHVATSGITPPAGWTPSGGTLSTDAIALAAAWRFYRRPESEPAKVEQPDVTLVPPSPSAPDWDFHQRVGALGDYPVLLCRLGLVVRLRVARPDTPPASVRVIPRWDGQPLPGRDLTPRTRCVLDGTRFSPEAAPGSALRDGALDLTGADERVTSPLGFRLAVVDADGAALKLVHTAASLVRRRWLRTRGLVRDERRPEGLAALRTGGIAITLEGHAHGLKERLERFDTIAPAAADDAPSELLADDLARGFRVEVQDVTEAASGAWRSLCRREGTYHVLDDNGVVLDTFALSDQGYVKRTAATSADSKSSPLYLHEALVRWTGWSLVAPRPGRRIRPVHGTRTEPDGRVVPTQDEAAVPPAPEVEPKLHLATVFRPPGGTLPRLRFGHSYRFRLPWVDLAGEALPATDTMPASDAIAYRRFEPLGPPALLPRSEFTAGESLERLVIRSDTSRSAADYVDQVLKPIDPGYHATAARHIFPAKVTQEQAEQHGMLDTAIGSADPDLVARGWRVSLRADLNLSTPSVPPVAAAGPPVPFGDPAAGTIAGSGEHYAINRHGGPLPTPYLADPLAAAVALRGLPGADTIAAGAALQSEPVPGVPAEQVCQVPFDGPWPDVRSFRIRVVDRPGTVDPATGVESFAHASDPPNWDPAKRVLTVFLAKGEFVRVPFSTVPDGERLHWMGAPAWLEAAPGSDLQRQIELGCHWMSSPARSMTLVHAVQRPLAAAGLLSAQADKELGATTATLHGRMHIHAATTGQVTLLAAWQDPLDDGSAASLSTVPGGAVLDAFKVPVPLAEGSPADTAFPPVLPPEEPVTSPAAQHEFGDTKHRLVQYRVRASSRFREYFPAELQGAPAADGSDGFSNVGAPHTVSIPNSEQPLAPAVRFVVPSFEWEGTDPASPATWTGFTRARRGGGIRVFLDRPWFTSGPGEQLGVVVPRPGETLPDTLGTQLGVDPTLSRLSTPQMPALEGSMFDGCTIHNAVVLADGTVVDVLGYDPVLDADRNQWYADVAVDMSAFPRGYWPFIRLALVRFQPSSVERAAASKVVPSEFTQLAPDRELTVSVAGNDVSAVVRGAGASAGPPNLMLIALDEADSADPDEFGWRPVAASGTGSVVGDEPEARLADAVEPVPDAGGLRWERTASMPGPRGDRTLRLIVRELELRQADGDVVRERFAGVPASTPLTTRLIRSRLVPRIVYADSVRLA